MGWLCWFERKGLKSEKGEGSTFYFTIPYMAANKITKNKQPLSTYSDRADIWTNKTILIVEDTLSSYLLLLEILAESGANLLHAQNGKEAIELCNSTPEISLVLMDIQLPLMSGYDAIREIKQIKKDLPIIAQTANAFIEEKEKSFQAGCDDYIIKPFTKKKLYSVINKYFT